MLNPIFYFTKQKLMPIKIDRTGEKHINNKGYPYTIITYKNSQCFQIKFDDDETIINCKSYNSVTKGLIKHPTKIDKFVYGVGYNTKNCNREIFLFWSMLLRRCYSKEEHLRNPTYSNCSVVEDWKDYKIFEIWYKNNFIISFRLDKDILVKGNKIYGPDTCCFVPEQINNLFTKSEKTRGEYPIGVRIDKRRNNFNANMGYFGNNKFLGTYNTQELAFNAYKIGKEKYIKEIADIWKAKISDNVYQAMYNYKVEITD